MNKKSLGAYKANMWWGTHNNRQHNPVAPFFSDMFRTMLGVGLLGMDMSLDDFCKKYYRVERKDYLEKCLKYKRGFFGSSKRKEMQLWLLRLRMLRVKIDEMRQNLIEQIANENAREL